MPSPLRQALHRFIPEHFHDPFGLALRLLRTRDPAARFAMESALVGLLLTPLDLLLQASERRRYAAASRPRLPIVFVCGPARSGTTLVAQTLTRHLPVAYINNVTAVFPRSPLTANAIFGRLIGPPRISYGSYYGRTRHWSGPNDGLHLWDRWLGKDRTAIRSSVTDAEAIAMRRFFGAMEQATGKPLVNKNNSLNAWASVVAQVLDNSWFLCLRRNPAFLAQSLLKARSDIHGRVDVRYGLADPGAPNPEGVDPVEDICRQVSFHESLCREQQRQVGSDRFWVISYEAFCRNPPETVRRVAGEILGQPPGPELEQLQPFEVSEKVRDPSAFKRIEEMLGRTASAS